MCGAADNVAAPVASCRNCLRASLMAMLHELSTSQTHPIIFNNGLNVCCLPGGPKTSCVGAYTECPLLAQSGHERLRVVAVQIDGRTPFRRSQIPAVISQHRRAPEPWGYNATPRSHQSNCLFSDS